MGIFGGSAQDQVDLGAINDRLARLESAVASLQGQLAALTTGAVAAGPPNALAGTDPGQIPYGSNVAGGAWLDEVRQLKDDGKLINAIKLYREKTGLGLKEAKDAVEGLI
ncbi:ribosomal protein L7/L12 [Nocardioides halotolerans]|jgi:ribosomal protein L7/L12|uniref:ribosomal protein L7/L12 n=1 Tax=Nocardioides halotolerans TaxID=433660 RepID=UPI00041D73AC|nr:ribosomal protein L7/L12 [Nocardioides halotolerans]